MRWFVLPAGALCASLGFRPAVAMAHAGTNCRPGGVTASAGKEWKSPLERVVTLQARELSLRAALDHVSAQARIRLTYVTEYLPVERRVCGSGTPRPVGAVLEDLLDGAGVELVVVGADHVALAPVARAVARRESARLVTGPPLLERMVITGSAAEASAHRLTIAVDVIDGRTLRERGVTTLSQALDGLVPGIWVWAQSPSVPVARFASIRGASSFGLTQPKVYVDGVEMANPLLLARLSPEAVERIEVIRGPQGAALYGADAISGVINIVSRHEAAPSDGHAWTVRSTVGYANSAFSANVVPTQQHAVSFHAGPSTRSVGGTADLATLGAYIPEGSSRNAGLHFGARLVGGRSTLLINARGLAATAGPGESPLLDSANAPSPDPMGGPAPSETQRTRQYTVGATGTFLQSERWTHTATIGVDGYSLTNPSLQEGPFPTTTDSALRTAVGGADRGVARTSSAARLWRTPRASASVRIGLEHTTLRERTRTVDDRQGFGFEPRREDAVAVRHSTGILAQPELSWGDEVFVTGGVRVERASGFSDRPESLLLPMIGASWMHRWAGASLKIHGAYGKGIRPPRVEQRSAFIHAFNRPAVSTLRSEVQDGVELSTDLVIGDLLTVRATRFDQQASGLLQSVAIANDAQPSGRPGQAPRVAYELQNVGQIANRGWELQSTVGRGALSVTGVLSLVRSRVTAVDAAYTGDLRVGDRPLEVPSRIASLTASWRARRWQTSWSVVRASDWTNYDRLALGEAFLGGERPPRDLVGSGLRQYWREYEGVTRLRMSASRELVERMSVYLTGENLLNYQRGEPDNATIVPGRMLTLGVGARF